ncbi:TPA: hypothetical protein ACG2TO_004176 [Klebsiella pneumoniae]|uniref:hypothetical protein n=1 Tax=Klebsiella pneumoniae TaxID=573 RepID=UPI003730A488
MSRKDIRLERKSAKAEKRREKSVRLAASFQNLAVKNQPKVAFLPDLEKIPTIGSSFGTLDVPKQPVANESGSRFGRLMTWCARHADVNGQWEWGELRQWNEGEWDDPIILGMNALQGLDWQEIQKMASGERHLMHHDHDITDLCDEAVARWMDLGYEQFDTIFRFRLGNTRRAWGIELHGHFYLIWYERKHKIYPTSEP